MAIKPILFNTEMVRAILDGRKTCTRRIVRPPYFVDGDENDKRSLITLRTATKNSSLYRQIGQMPYPDAPYRMCDILYVRETWKKAPNGYYYYEDWQRNDIADVTKWKPSIHMPKEAARIWLKVTDVRVERLNEITNDGCVAEGIYPSNCRECNAAFGCDTCIDEGYSEIDEFTEVWNSTIKKSDIDRYGWDASPWVWVVEFERCEKPACMR